MCSVPAVPAVGVVQAPLLQGEVDHGPVAVLHLHVEVLGLGAELVQPAVVDGGQTCLGSHMESHMSRTISTKSCVKSQISHSKRQIKRVLISHTRSVILSHMKRSLELQQYNDDR